MASGNNYPQDWIPVPRTASFRTAQPPRKEERVSLPKNSDRALRPKPLNTPSKPPRGPSVLKSAQSLRKDSGECHEGLPDPEIVDIGPPTAPRQRRNHAGQRARRAHAPSRASQYLTQQSEMALGLLDYYIHPTVSVHSPAPPHPPPTLNPAIVGFDFGELPPTPAPSAAPSPTLPSRPLAPPSTPTKEKPRIPISSPPSAPNRPAAPPGRGYSLFPAIQEVTPPPRHPAITLISPATSRDMTSPPRVSGAPCHPNASPVHRPRKESISSSVRTRHDSITGFSSRAKQPAPHPPIPLRILGGRSDSVDSSPMSHRRLISTAAEPALGATRWSDETVTSPCPAPTLGPRTSFGSLVRRDGPPPRQYPDCFFEDDSDEEEAPLWKRWAQKRPVHWDAFGRRPRTSAARKSLHEGKGGFWKAMMCGCGGRG